MVSCYGEYIKDQQTVIVFEDFIAQLLHHCGRYTVSYFTHQTLIHVAKLAVSNKALNLPLLAQDNSIQSTSHP